MPASDVARVLARSVGIKLEPRPPALEWMGSKDGCHDCSSCSASARTCLASLTCAKGWRTSPGTTGVSSSKLRSRRPCLARMICFSARSMVAAKLTSYASLTFWRVYHFVSKIHTGPTGGSRVVSQYLSTVLQQPDSVPRRGRVPARG